MPDISFLSQIGISIGKQNNLPKCTDSCMERAGEGKWEREPSDLSLSPKKSRDSFGLVMRRILRQQRFTGPPPQSKDLSPPVNIQGNEVPKMEGKTIKEVVMDLKEGLQLQAQPEKSDSKSSSDNIIAKTGTNEDLSSNVSLQELINKLLGPMNAQFNNLLTQVTSQLNNMLANLPAELNGVVQSITGGQFQLIGSAIQFMATPQGMVEELSSLLGFAPELSNSTVETGDNALQSLLQSMTKEQLSSPTTQQPLPAAEQAALTPQPTPQDQPVITKGFFLKQSIIDLEKKLFASNVTNDSTQDIAIPLKNNPDTSKSSQILPKTGLEGELSALFKKFTDGLLTPFTGKVTDATHFDIGDLVDITPFHSKDALQFDNDPFLQNDAARPQNLPLNAAGFVTSLNKMPADFAVVNGTPVHIPKFIDDVAGKVAIGYVRLTSKDGEMVIHLNPPELGRLTVKVALEDGALKAHFVAPSADVKQLLDQNLASLRQMLEAQGLSIQDLLVSLKDRQSDNSKSGENSNTYEVGARGSIDAEQEKTRYQIVNYSLTAAQVNYFA